MRVKGGRAPSTTRRHAMTKQPEHPHADGDGYVMTHRLIAERVLGRYLSPTNVVHHASTTLVICEDQAYHMLLHRRMRAIQACGNPNARRCWICKQWGMDVGERGNSDCAHQRCRQGHERERYLKNKERVND